MKANSVTDILGLLVVVGGIMVMVRPNSQGPALVKSFTDGFSSMLATATGSIPSGFRSGF